MTVFIDASVLVAIIAGEPGADALSDRMQRYSRRICSPLAAWETMSALCRSHRMAPDAARDLLRLFLEAGNIETISIGPREYDLAAEAYERFGKGRHPAALNMGDCFSYACAQAHGAAPLHTGDDFALTDLA